MQPVSKVAFKKIFSKFESASGPFVMGAENLVPFKYGPPFPGLSTGCFLMAIHFQSPVTSLEAAGGIKAKTV